MKIKKICEWCGTTFYAQKLTSASVLIGAVILHTKKRFGRRQAEKERASQEILDQIIAYTKQLFLVSYFDEAALNRLCGYITEYYMSDSLPKIEPVKVDSQLKSIDIMHFGWNEYR